MGYFDALVRYSLTTAPDGRRLFFPWGVIGPAYVVGSELNHERLRRRTKFSFFVTIGLIIFSELALPQYLYGYVAVALLVASAAWMQYLLRDLALPAERLSLEESATLQARGRSLESLWSLMILAIGFLAYGVIIFAIDPDANWLLATDTIVLFGWCAVVGLFMLVVRQRG